MNQQIIINPWNSENKLLTENHVYTILEKGGFINWSSNSPSQQKSSDICCKSAPAQNQCFFSDGKDTVSQAKCDYIPSQDQLFTPTRN